MGNRYAYVGVRPSDCVNAPCFIVLNYGCKRTVSDCTRLVISSLQQSMLSNMINKGNLYFLTFVDITRLVDVQNMLKTSHFLETKWLSLGLQLGLLMNTLKKVDAQHERDVNRCLLECLSLWLQRVDKVDEKGGPTWDALANALSNIGENVCADNARQKSK